MQSQEDHIEEQKESSASYEKQQEQLSSDANVSGYNSSTVEIYDNDCLFYVGESQRKNPHIIQLMDTSQQVQQKKFLRLFIPSQLRNDQKKSLCQRGCLYQEKSLFWNSQTMFFKALSHNFHSRQPSSLKSMVL